MKNTYLIRHKRKVNVLYLIAGLAVALVVMVYIFLNYVRSKNIEKVPIEITKLVNKTGELQDCTITDVFRDPLAKMMGLTGDGNITFQNGDGTESYLYLLTCPVSKN